MSILSTPFPREAIENLPQAVKWVETYQNFLDHDGDGTITETVIDTTKPFMVKSIDISAISSAWQFQVRVRDSEGNSQDTINVSPDATDAGAPSLERISGFSGRQEHVYGALGFYIAKDTGGGASAEINARLNEPLLFPNGGRIRFQSAFAGQLNVTAIIHHFELPD